VKAAPGLGLICQVRHQHGIRVVDDERHEEVGRIERKHAALIVGAALLKHQGEMLLAQLVDVSLGLGGEGPVTGLDEFDAGVALAKPGLAGLHHMTEVGCQEMLK